MRILVVFREGPAQAVRVRDGIDLALAALAFDHELDVLFTGDGAALLRETGELGANLRALAFHGAHAIGVDAALAAPSSPVLDAQPLDAAAQRAWFACADHVFAC